MTKLDRIEDKILELWHERDKVHLQAEAKAQAQAKLAEQKARAREALPELREREREAWKRYHAAVDEVQAAIDELDGLRPELGRAFAKLRGVVPKRLRGAIKHELERRQLLARKARDAEADRKRRAHELRKQAQDMERRRKRMAGGGGSVEQGRQRIASMKESADRLEGKLKPTKPAVDEFIPPDVAMRHAARRGA